MKKTLLGLTCALALVAGAQAQTTTTQSTTSQSTTAGGVTATNTTTTTDTSLGTITEFTPGTSVMLRTESATAPVSYKFGKTVTYVTEDGKVVESSTIRKDSKVRVHYVKQGNDMMVDKVIVVK